MDGREGIANRLHCGPCAPTVAHAAARQQEDGACVLAAPLPCHPGVHERRDVLHGLLAGGVDLEGSEQGRQAGDQVSALQVGGWRAGEQLEQHDAKGVDVAGRGQVP